MTILKILHVPDKRLRKVAKPVKKINVEILHIINNMFDTMYAKEGIGLAATQVNIHLQIIVIDLFNNHKNNLVLINPKLIEKSGETSIEEGCLSVQNQRVMIPRAKTVKVRALNRLGKLFELDTNGLLAICIQHEMDHLIGKLIIDYLSPLKQQYTYLKNKKADHQNKKNNYLYTFI